MANVARFFRYRVHLKLQEHGNFLSFLPGKHFLLLFVSHKVGQMENISPGQIIDEPIRPVNIPRKEKDFQGMLEYKKEDEQKLVKNLILGKCFLHGMPGLSGTCVSGGKDLSLICETSFFSYHYTLCSTVLQKHPDRVVRYHPKSRGTCLRPTCKDPLKSGLLSSGHTLECPGKLLESTDAWSLPQTDYIRISSVRSHPCLVLLRIFQGILKCSHSSTPLL